MALFLIQSLYIKKPLFSRVVTKVKYKKKYDEKRHLPCLEGEKCYLLVSPFCWTDSQIDNPWFKCTWWKWPIFSTVKMYLKKKKNHDMPIPVTHVNVGASREFSCGSIPQSPTVLNVSCLFQRLKNQFTWRIDEAFQMITTVCFRI